jgi:GntR family transcriptional regulator, rspAB operon transcriptional repressor
MKVVLAKHKLDRRTPLREQIYKVVKKLILSGAIAPGGIIDEKEIASLLKVSRTPVREAVKKLSDERLVDVVAQSGTRASLIDPNEVREAYMIRKVLEVESAAQAAPRMTGGHADSLSDILLTHARALERKDFSEAIDRDDEFHRKIAEIAELPRLWQTVEISKAQLDRCRHLMIPRAGEGEITLEHHRAIIRALVSKNAEFAREAMRVHLDRSYDNITKGIAVEDTR